MTKLHMQLIETVRGMIVDDTLPAHIDIAERFYGSREAISSIKLYQIIKTIKRNREWPFEDMEQEDGRVSRFLKENTIKESPIKDETEVLMNIVRLLNSLKSDSMRKIIESIKNGGYSFDEIAVLKEISLLLKDIDNESKNRIFEYIGSRFKI